MNIFLIEFASFKTIRKLVYVISQVNLLHLSIFIFFDSLSLQKLIRQLNNFQLLSLQSQSSLYTLNSQSLQENQLNPFKKYKLNTNMIKNRLMELTECSNRTTSVGSRLSTPLIAPGSIVDQFSYARAILQKIGAKTTQINQLRNEYKRQAHPFRQRQIADTIDNIIKDVKQILLGLQKQTKMLSQKYVHTTIQENFNENKQNVNANREANGSKKAMTIDLTKKAKIATEDFRNAEKRYTFEVRETIKRRAQVIQGRVSQQQVDQILANPQKAQQMLLSSLMNSPSVQLQNAVSDIIDKCRDIIRLQKNIQQVFEMQQELALLVQLQGQVIDTIQATIIDAKDFVEDGQKALVKAQQQHKSGNKKIFCIIILVLILIGIVVIPIVITQT